MSRVLLLAVLATAFGACLALLGGYNVTRDWRTGVVRGRVSSFSRSGSPKVYWFAMSATVLTTLIGLIFLAAGVVLMASQFEG